MPLPAAKKPNKIPSTVEVFFLCVSRMTPGHVEVKDPANNSYRMQNNYVLSNQLGIKGQNHGALESCEFLPCRWVDDQSRLYFVAYKKGL